MTTSLDAPLPPTRTECPMDQSSICPPATNPRRKSNRSIFDFRRAEPAVRGGLRQVSRQEGTPPSALPPNTEHFRGFTYFHLNAKARIWPLLSYTCHIRGEAFAKSRGKKAPSSQPCRCRAPQSILSTLTLKHFMHFHHLKCFHRTP